jgi:hypothetical protein
MRGLVTIKLQLPKGGRGLVVTAGIAATLAVVGVTTAPAWAGSRAPTSAPAVSSTPPGPSTPSGLTAVKRRVDRRVNQAIAAINGITAPKGVHLTAAELSVARADLNTLRAGLNRLKTKVDGETSVAAVRADVRAARHAAASNPTLEQGVLLVKAAAANRYLDAVSNKIGPAQTRIDAAKQAGKDVAAAQTALADARAKVADARSHLGGFAPALLSAKPPATGFAAARTSLAAVRTDIVAIRHDASLIRQVLGLSTPSA